ncbi:LacI family DNA-binding transcriptional regulator [Clostridium estertheticum]|uniref:LacI family DNA-binding transcriptional regulator n=1 Tax=Clostridium estertheticum TaxID=238834 RepID=A0A7Y3SSI6_9CLOT|nr:LacI family DNA-binding transcriptional regulator [Clostridium estertheticum]MBW9172222.1 LacI family transcriptional regulator [Clostridium estertheticum]NNU74561.1 LacI family DNA-binding transcriptional regulator [Clostridium estertheticum]WBL48941.1 LacI family transcriptional regulator [Clostridium estertheticum]WLC76993.1 LacI family transcriptional regulator [Clostridium estertheticum]
MEVTIKDIAKIAKVSHTTVSRALNNSPFISDLTKAKIMTIAKELNYVPNYSAKSLVLNRSYNIGLIFTTISEATSSRFFYETISGVNSAIKGSYNLVVRGIDDYKDFTSVNRKRFDGIILMSQSNSDNSFIYYLMEKKIPLVVLNRYIDESSIVNILSSDKKGVYEAVNYLIQNGHKDIAIIEGKKGFNSTTERKNGFLDALIENKIQINSNYIVEGNYTIGSGYDAMKKLLSLSEIPTAVFCSNDEMAIGAMKATVEAGLNVPNDISIMGFDGMQLGDYLTPALTTVRRPIIEISKIGAEKLLSIIENNTDDGEKIYISTELIKRDSVAKLT